MKPASMASPSDTNAPPHAAGGSVFEGKLTVAPRFYRQWMLAGNPAHFMARLIQDFGDFVQYRGLINFYLINHPTLIGQVLKETHRTYDKNSRVYNRFRNAFGNGLTVAEGEHWKRQRKLMQPVFGPSSVRNFFDMMLDAATQTARKWSTRYSSGEVFEMAFEMDKLALEVAGRAFFSQAFEGSSDQIRKWTRIINHYCALPPLPVISNLRFPSPLNLRLRRALGEYRIFVQTMIRSRVNEAGKGDLLDLLLTAKDEETGDTMDEDDIAEEVLGMLIGGHETNSAAMTWIWFELHHHPDVAQRLFEEIESVCGGQPLKFEQLEELRYTKMVIQEVLRLHPPFWFENRNTMCDVELGGTLIPQGSMIAFSRYSLHRHPGFWKDPDEFRPERFDPVQPENPPSSDAYIPFGKGPRVCIGRHFAMMEMLVITVTILQKFRVVIDATDRHEMVARMTMSPKHGLKVRLEPKTGTQ
jgi:cytochrome P450